MTAPDRQGFSLATYRLVASLRNGHTTFIDTKLRAEGGSLPFAARKVEGRYTVTRSSLPALPPGAVIDMLDGRPVDEAAAPIRALFSESSDRTAADAVFHRAWPFPDRFTLGIDGGRSVTIDKRAAAPGPERGLVLADKVTATRRPDGVVVIRIPSFGEPEFEKAAVEAVRANAGAKALVFDLRGNGGGSSPAELGAAIMDRPYRGTIVATPMTIAQFDADAVFDPAANPLPAPLVRYGPQLTQPEKDAWTGRIALLVDGGCFSACEDFVIRFRAARRGPVVGETTGGSTGQPYFREWPEFGMAAAVSTKREYFPDGAPFEGVGISPDVPAPLTRAELRSGRDLQLERAVAAALSPAPPKG